LIPASGVHRLSLFSSPSSARTSQHLLLSSSHFSFRFNPTPTLHCPPAAAKRSADYRVQSYPPAKPTSEVRLWRIGDNWKDYNPPAVTQDMEKGIPFSIEAGTPSSRLRNKNLEGLIAAVLMFVQTSSPLPYFGWEPFPISPANAVLYLPDTKVRRTGELALRKAIPANANMKAIQDSLEDISYLLRTPQRKPYGTMEGNVKKKPLRFQDFLSCCQSNTRTIQEELFEFTIEKGDGLAFSPEVGGELRKTVKIQVTVCGYSAVSTTDSREFRKTGKVAEPHLTFMQYPFLMVVHGAYDGAKLDTINQAIITDTGLDKNSSYSIPLEIMPSGQFEPLCRTKSSVQSTEQLQWHIVNVSEAYSAPYQLFFYLYDKRNVIWLRRIIFLNEGQFSVFGYVSEALPNVFCTSGFTVLSFNHCSVNAFADMPLAEGIQSAKIVDGQDRLILPTQS
ncbi:unnamed protein product, partial [Linum tenue]